MTRNKIAATEAHTSEQLINVQYNQGVTLFLSGNDYENNYDLEKSEERFVVKVGIKNILDLANLLGCRMNDILEEESELSPMDDKQPMFLVFEEKEYFDDVCSRLQM